MGGSERYVHAEYQYLRRYSMAPRLNRKFRLLCLHSNKAHILHILYILSIVCTIAMAF